jgi:hypothetical protein
MKRLRSTDSYLQKLEFPCGVSRGQIIIRGQAEENVSMTVMELGSTIIRKSWQVNDFITYFNIVHAVRHVLYRPFTYQLSCITLCFFAQRIGYCYTRFNVYGHYLQGDH